MQIFYFKRLTELKRTKTKLEKELNVKIVIKGRKVIVEGSSLNEFVASSILDAMNFGFSAKKSLLLKDDMTFRIVNIKDFTKKKNLKGVRGRIIGREGRTKKTIENISSCYIIINDNEIGIIGETASIEKLITAIGSLVRGTKQSHTYRYLEKLNKIKNE